MRQPEMQIIEIASFFNGDVQKSFSFHLVCFLLGFLVLWQGLDQYGGPVGSD
jgi:hypothetical protein